MVQTIPDQLDLPFVDGPDPPGSTHRLVCGMVQTLPDRLIASVWMVFTIRYLLDY
jgi:hypothetical protein